MNGPVAKGYWVVLAGFLVLQYTPFLTEVSNAAERATVQTKDVMPSVHPSANPTNVVAQKEAVQKLVITNAPASTKEKVKFPEGSEFWKNQRKLQQLKETFNVPADYTLSSVESIKEGETATTIYTFISELDWDRRYVHQDWYYRKGGLGRTGMYTGAGFNFNDNMYKIYVRDEDNKVSRFETHFPLPPLKDETK